MTATSGRKCYAQYGRYSPLGSLVRTLLASSRWYSPARRLTWEAQALCSRRITYTERSSGSPSTKSAKVLSVRDMLSSRLLFRLVPSARPTGETGSGLLQDLLPTPTVMEDRRKPNGDTVRQKKLMSNLNPFSIQELLPTPTAIDGGTGRMNKSRSPNAAERPTIAMAARMGLLPTAMTQGLKRSGENGRTEFYPLELLPTPNAAEGEKWTTKYNPNSQMGKGLTAMALNNLLPTPMSTDIHHGKRVKELKAAGGDTFHSRANGETRPNGLTDFLDFNGLLATPTARDWKGAQGRAYKGESMDLPMQVCPPTDGATSQLNPLFVQEMMGFPADWLVSPFLGGEPKP